MRYLQVPEFVTDVGSGNRSAASCHQGGNLGARLEGEWPRGTGPGIACGSLSRVTFGTGSPVGSIHVSSRSPSLAGFGVALPTLRVDGRRAVDVLEFAKEAEAAGFDSVWAPDHLQSAMPSEEPLVTLSAVSAVTSDVTLGTIGLLLGLRHLVWTAKSIASLSGAAPGRLVVGVGRATASGDFVAAGVPRSGSGHRLDESMVVVRDLLRGDRVEHNGEHLQIAAGPLQSAPQHATPLAISARSVEAINRAAMFADGWLALGLAPDVLERRITELRATRAALGHGDMAVDLIVFVNLDSDRERALRDTTLTMHERLGMPAAAPQDWAIVGDEDHVTEQLERFLAAGVGGFIVALATPEPRRQLEQLVRVRERLRPRYAVTRTVR